MFRQSCVERTLLSAAVELIHSEKQRHPQENIVIPSAARNPGVLRDAPPRRNKRAFSTLPNCLLSIVNYRR
jgi:hypothetical protein